MRGHDELREAQVEDMLAIVDTPRFCLWADVGAGKTATSLTAVAWLLAVGEVSRVLIVAPKKVAETVWANEALQWQHTRTLDIAKCLGTPTERQRVLDMEHDITLINLENLKWLLAQYSIKRWPFDMVILDESQAFKNAGGKRYRALEKYTRGLVPKRDGTLRKVESPITRLVELTATPSTNSLLDLWSQAALVDDGEALGRSMDAYLGMHFHIPANNKSRHPKPVANPGSRERIFHKARHFAKVRRLERDPSRPMPIFNTVTVQLPPKVRQLYNKFKRDLLVLLESGEKLKSPTAGAKFGKLMQICNGSAVVGETIGLSASEKVWEVLHNAKLDALDEVLDSMDYQGEHVLIGYWFREDARRIKERHPDAVVMTSKNTVEVEAAWNRGEIKKLLVQEKSAAAGLNLQFGGSQLVYFSLPPLDLEVWLQLNGRLDRPGQTEQVVITAIVVENSVEQEILSGLYLKDGDQNALLDDLWEHRMVELL